jgi:hypothetical protein
MISHLLAGFAGASLEFPGALFPIVFRLFFDCFLRVTCRSASTLRADGSLMKSVASPRANVPPAASVLVLPLYFHCCLQWRGAPHSVPAYSQYMVWQRLDS